MNTFSHCCGSTNEPPSGRMICNDSSERISVIAAAPASAPRIVP